MMGVQENKAVINHLCSLCPLGGQEHKCFW